MFKKEPAIIIGAIIAFLQILLAAFANNADTVMNGTTNDSIQGLAQMPAIVGASPGWMTWAMPVLTMLGSWFIRRKVYPVEKIRDAGFSPSMIKKRAADPSVATATGE